MQIRIRHLASERGRKCSAGAFCISLALVVWQTKDDAMRGAFHNSLPASKVANTTASTQQEVKQEMMS